MITSPEAIKLIAIDIDGTLLTPQKTVSLRTLTAIQAAQAAGITVTLATARRYANSKQFADMLGITIPIITCDGALIIEHPTGKMLHTRLLDAEIAQQAVNLLVEHKLQPVIHHLQGNTEETWSGPAEFDNPGLEGYFQEFPRVQRMSHHMLCNGQPDHIRVVSFAIEEAIAHVMPSIAQLPCAWNAITRGNYGTAEIVVMQTGCSKASGVMTLAQHLNIPMGQVMALGDNNNDFEMLEAAGWGVAMGQAPERVKAIANAVTASNQEDGVAVAIERYALPSRV
jgi:Cof subfamily protein (haloacid dehalogenase superfamily)